MPLLNQKFKNMKYFEQVKDSSSSEYRGSMGIKSSDLDMEKIRRNRVANHEESMSEIAESMEVSNSNFSKNKNSKSLN